MILLIAIFLFTNYYPTQKTETKSSTLVTKVIDGDTLELASGKKVRLIGIDSPEEGKPFYLESKNFLRKLVENKEVTLERDSANADKYGRLLRYVYSGDTFVNLAMLKEGYASFYSYGSNQKFSKEFSAAEKSARENKLGMWKTSKS